MYLQAKPATLQIENIPTWGDKSGEKSPLVKEEYLCADVDLWICVIVYFK